MPGIARRLEAAITSLVERYNDELNGIEQSLEPAFTESAISGALNQSSILPNEQSASIKTEHNSGNNFQISTGSSNVSRLSASQESIKNESMMKEESSQEARLEIEQYVNSLPNPKI